MKVFKYTKYSNDLSPSSYDKSNTITKKLLNRYKFRRINGI